MEDPAAPLRSALFGCSVRSGWILTCFRFTRLDELIPTLTVGLLDFKVYVVLARPEPDCSAQLHSIPAVPNRRVSLQCLTAENPCSAQPQSIPASSAQSRSIPAVPNHKVSQQCPTVVQPQSIPAVPNRKVSPQFPTAEYPCSAQPQSIPAVPNDKVSQQCPTAEYPSSAQSQSIPAVHKRTQSVPAVPNRRVSLQCPTAEYPYSARPQSISIVSIRGVSTVRASFTADTCSTLSLEVVDVALERRRVKGGDVRSR